MKKTYFSFSMLAILMLTSFFTQGFAQTNCNKPLPPNTDDVRPTAIDWVWENRMKNECLGFHNFMMDQIFDNGGYLNYIVRWESDEQVTSTQRDAIETMLKKQVNKWVDVWLAAYDCWPFGAVEVNVVAWAVADRSVLLWNDNEWDGKVYVGYNEGDAPHGSQDCNRFHHQDGNYPNCTDEHFDEALWCTKGFEGGAGGDWGQRVSSTYILQNLSADNVHILLHEMGHSNGLPDFYDANQFPPNGIPAAIMQAGASTVITPFDGWLLRRVYSELKESGNRDWDFSGGNSCDPSTISLYTQINDGSWEQSNSVSVSVGDEVKFGPQPTSEGSWSWNGPLGFSASSREVTIENIQESQAGSYVASYTNACGAKSTQSVIVSVGSSLPATNIALTASTTTSFISSWETLGAVNDNASPANSSDNSNGAYGNWNGSENYNTLNWVEYAWDNPQILSSTEVYWWDDNGGIDQPTEAYVQYFNGSSWVTSGNIGLELNQWNTLSLNNVTTQNLRIYMKSAAATGILEWKVMGTSDSSLKNASAITAQTNKASAVMVYPNPAALSDVITLKIETPKNEQTHVSIVNVQGQLIFDKSVGENKVEIRTSSLLKSGIYYVTVKNSFTNTTQKLVVK